MWRVVLLFFFHVLVDWPSFASSALQFCSFRNLRDSQILLSSTLFYVRIHISPGLHNPSSNHWQLSFLALPTPEYGLRVYSAAQICPNQNIRVMRVSPIRVYAYAHTHVRVCIYAHTRIQYIRVCLIGMYELAYCFFFSYRSLLFSMARQLATERERAGSTVTHGKFIAILA